MLEGHAALITGSTSGIGLTIAEHLVELGCHVVINGFGKASEIEETRKRLEQLSPSGAKVLYHAADVTSHSQVLDMITSSEKIFGRCIDIVVNNAGIQFTAPIEEFPIERFQAVIEVCLMSNFYTIRETLGKMRKNNWGRIINIASAHGQVGSKHKSAYCSAKHGVIGMTKVVALETAKTGVTCNAICPGWVLTPLVQKQIEKRAQENGTSVETETKSLVSEKHPSGEFVKAKDIAKAVEFLCSDAANQMRGVSLTLDGGWTAQ